MTKYQVCCHVATKGRRLHHNVCVEPMRAGAFKGPSLDAEKHDSHRDADRLNANELVNAPAPISSV